MRRSVFLVVGCMLSLLVGAGPALADAGPHVAIGPLGNATPDSCAGCHRAHTGQAAYLLKQKQEQLCFSCHGSAATGSNLDVQDGAGYSGTGRGGGVAGALRGGGFKFALIDTSKVEKAYNSEGRLSKATIPALPLTEAGNAAATTSAHSIDESSQMAWGNSEPGVVNAPQYGNAVNLTCGSCHDPHGNGNYRILRPVPNGAEQSKATTKVTPVEIKEPTSMTHVYTTANYWESWDPNDTAFEAKISSWCATCHTRLLATDTEGPETEVNAKGETVKVKHQSYATSSGDSVFNYRHRTEFSAETFEKVAKEHTEGKQKAEPNCIQCHVSHGTDATMSGYAVGVTPNGGATGEPASQESFLLRLNEQGRLSDLPQQVAHPPTPL